jgi:hypothetical protein
MSRTGRLASLAELFLRGEIPTSAQEHGYCGPNARFVEDQLGLPRSVYFYAGRAHPSYGRVALAFSPSSENDRFDSATPFDSGGLIKPTDRIGDAFRIDLAPDDLPTRLTFCRACVVKPPSAWRDELARWFAAYYPRGAAGYWEQRPLADPENLYSSNGDNWPAWTWEVRLHQGPNPGEAEAWTADIGYINELNTQLATLSLGEDTLSAIADFRKRCLTPMGSATFCEEIETWTRQKCGLPT